MFNAKPVIPRILPTFVGNQFSDNLGITLKPMAKSANDTNRFTTLEILKDILCKEDEVCPFRLKSYAYETGGTEIYSSDKYGYGTLKIYTQGNPPETFVKNGDHIVASPRNGSAYLPFQNLKVLETGNDFIIAKIMDENFRFDPTYIKDGVTLFSLLDLKKRLFGWKILDYQKGKYIVIRPGNTNKRNCYVFLMQDAANLADKELMLDKKCCDAYFPGRWASVTVPRYTGSYYPQPYLLSVFMLSDYESQRGVIANIKRFRVTTTERDGYQNLKHPNYISDYINPVIIPNFFSSTHLTVDNWILYGDSRYFHFACLPTNSSVGFIDISMGEMDAPTGINDTVFMLAGYNSVDIQGKIVFDISSALSVSDKQKMSVTYPGVDKECYTTFRAERESSFGIRANPSVNSTSNSFRTNSNVLYKPNIISGGNNPTSVFPVLYTAPLYVYNTRKLSNITQGGAKTSFQIKYIQDELFLLMNHEIFDSVALPLTHSFRQS